MAGPGTQAQLGFDGGVGRKVCVGVIVKVAEISRVRWSQSMRRFGGRRSQSMRGKPPAAKSGRKVCVDKSPENAGRKVCVAECMQINEVGR